MGCAQSFSCQTQLSLNCVKLFWSCFGVVVGVLTTVSRKKLKTKTKIYREFKKKTC